jgi:hypothetical protein
MRGYVRSSGFGLHGRQQGDKSIIDPDDPRSEEEQIAEAIDARMGDDPNDYPKLFQFTFNPSEFTELPDTDIVRQLTFIADYMAENYPQTEVLATNHGTAQEPTENYGVRYFDLPQFAPPNLGVKIHTLMFYDLMRPAPVYGNEDFRYLFDFMAREYRQRTLWYFPEAAWWLTFDIPVPLYLPITIEARSRDLENLAFMLEGKLDGHRVFGTGHEWGYWQNEYCSFRMAAFVGDYDWRDCIRDIAYTAGPEASVVVREVLERAIEIQERDMIYEHDVLRYLVGTDPETELADSVGIEFHPLPPTPQQIANWDEERAEDWLRRVGPMLERTADDYLALERRLDAVSESVPEAGRPWFDEIRDGIAVNGIRAQHQFFAYRALVRNRLSQLRIDPGLARQAQRDLGLARSQTERAIEVIRRREQGYRYQPLSRSIAGGPEGTEDSNWTVYNYRYLNRTHHGYYYKRIDDLVDRALTGSGDVFELTDAMIGPDETLELRIVDPELEDPRVDPGDGSAPIMGTEISHSYGSPGTYELVITGTRDGDDFEFRDKIVVLSEEFHTGFSGEVVAPEEAALIESVMPGLTFGPITGDRWALGFTAVETGEVQLGLWNELTEDTAASEAVATEPTSLTVPVVERSSGSISTSLTVDDGRLVRVTADGPAQLLGDLQTQAIVDAIVSIGGFDEGGARALVAQTLGFTPDTLPLTVPFELLFTVEDPDATP